MTKELDNCEICRGAKGGVRGNENIEDNIRMCDYCLVEYDTAKKNSIPKKRKDSVVKIIGWFAGIVSFYIVIYVLAFISPMIMRDDLNQYFDFAAKNNMPKC